MYELKDRHVGTGVSATRLIPLFACNPGAKSFIQRNCCLDCAVSKCLTEGFDQVIAGL